MAGDDWITSVGAQATAVTAIAVALGWWGRRVVRWWRKMRVWRNAVLTEKFAERAAQHIDATLVPRFDALGHRIGAVESKLDAHLEEAELRWVREEAAAEERDRLFRRLEQHMDAEDAKEDR